MAEKEHNVESVIVKGENFPMLNQPSVRKEKYPEVTASTLHSFKSKYMEAISEDMITSIDQCILELAKIQNEKVYRNLRLIIQPDFNSREKCVIHSGKGANKIAAYRSGPDAEDFEFVWYTRTVKTEPRSRLIQWMPFILFGLTLALIAGALIQLYVMYDFAIKAQAEGILTVRALTVDVHHDPGTTYYKLPQQDADGAVEYRYKED